MSHLFQKMFSIAAEPDTPRVQISSATGRLYIDGAPAEVGDLHVGANKLLYPVGEFRGLNGERIEKFCERWSGIILRRVSENGRFWWDVDHAWGDE